MGLLGCQESECNRVSAVGEPKYRVPFPCRNHLLAVLYGSQNHCSKLSGHVTKPLSYHEL